MARVLTRLRKKLLQFIITVKKNSAFNAYVYTLKRIVIPLLLCQKLAHQAASPAPVPCALATRSCPELQHEP